jgi:iron(III) transport system permease protein
LSRSLLILAALAFAIVALVPLGVMAARVELADLGTLGSARTLSLLGRTVGLGTTVALGALLLGLPFGWLVARTDVPGAPALRTAGVLPLLLPPLFLAMTWSPIVSLRGAPAAALVLILSTFPLVALFVARAAERVDGRREEAARLAGGLRAVAAMELPLLLPAALCGACIAFAFAVNDFAVPDYVSAVGPKFNVYADEVFASWAQVRSPGLAVATSLPLVVLVLAALVPALALRRRGALATIGGDFVPPTRLALGRGRWPALAFCGGVLLLACGVPLVRMLWEASDGPRTWREPPADALAALGSQWGALQGAFAEALDRARGDLLNSLLLACAAATLAVPLGLVLGHAAERLRDTRPAAARTIELVALLPIAAPAVLLGIGFVATWSRPWSAELYSSPALVVMLFLARYGPFAVLLLSGATASLSPTLEEAAVTSGAGPVRRLGSIVAPALARSLAGAWLLVFLFSMRELDAAILVPAANQTAMFRIFNGVHFGRDPFVFALCLLLVFTIALPGLLWHVFRRDRVEVAL